MLMFNVVYSKLSFGNPIVPLIKIHFRPSLQPSRSSLILYSSFLWWRFGTRYHPTTWLISYIYLQFTCAEVAQQNSYLISAYTITQCCGKLYVTHHQVLHFPWRPFGLLLLRILAKGCTTTVPCKCVSNKITRFTKPSVKSFDWNAAVICSSYIWKGCV
jgi:hypothetical protein